MADKSKDTGTGGINIEGKIYSADVGVPDAKGGSQGNYSSGNIMVDKTVKDLSKPTRETFAKYMSNSTLAKIGDATVPNSYPVGSGDKTSIRPLSLKDEKGYPVRPALSANEANFSPEFSSTMGIPAPLPLKKGLAQGKVQDGNTLLPNAAFAPLGSAISANVSLSIEGITSAIDTVSSFVTGLFGGEIKFTELQEPIRGYTDNVLSKNLYGKGLTERAIPGYDILGEPIDIGSLTVQGFYGPSVLRKPLRVVDRGTFNNFLSQPLPTDPVAILNDPFAAAGAAASFASAALRMITGYTAIERGLEELQGKNTPGEIKNVYAPVPDSTFGLLEAPTVRLLNDGGYPLSPSEAQENAPSYQYARNVPRAYTRKLNFLRKGKTYPDEGSADGHKLLRVGKGDTLEQQNQPFSAITDYVSQILKDNRFNPTIEKKAYISDFLRPTTKDGDTFRSGAGAKDFTFEPKPEEQKNASFARPDELKFGRSPGNDDKLKRKYDFEKLSTVAQKLMAQATQPIPDGQFAELDSETFKQSSIKVSAEQVFRDMVDTNKIENSFQTVAGGSTADKNVMLDINSKFETVLNSIDQKFSRFSSNGQIATAAALVRAIFKAYEARILPDIDLREGSYGGLYDPTKGFSNSNRGIGSFFGGPNTLTLQQLREDITYVFRSNISSPPTAARRLRYLNLRPTSAPFSRAALRGMVVFFGLKPPKNGDLKYSQIDRPTQDTNQTIVIARSIIRSAAQLNLQLKEITEFTQNNDRDKRSTDPFETKFEIFKTLAESRLMGVFNFFATVGDVNTLDLTDAAVTDASGEPMTESIFNEVTNTVDAGNRISSLDTSAEIFYPHEDPGTRYARTRLRSFRDGPNGKLTLAGDQTDTVLLKPDRYSLQLIGKLGGPSMKVTAQPEKSVASRIERENYSIHTLTNPQNSKNGYGRLSNELREFYERSLDAELMPFYFHDVRTNEIVSFHAFLTSINDDYAAAYESVEGFGRIEPVKIYKNTQRKIGLSFIIAAMDRDDFDVMWTKINKLTTMVYPQYTQGRRISIVDQDPNKEFDFVKPFTQQIAAAPMIRLRLGNLFTSNYSKFGLAKIFGLHDPKTLLQGLDRDGVIARQRAQDKAKQKIDDANRKLKLAQGRRARADKEEKRVRADKYNKKYDYKIPNDIKDNLAYAVGVLPVPKPDPKAQQNKGKTAKDQTAQPEKKYSQYVTDKNNKMVVLHAPTQKYGLVCNVEGVAELEENAEGPVEVKTVPYDPAKHQGDNIQFVVTFKKAPIARLIDFNVEQNILDEEIEDPDDIDDPEEKKKALQVIKEGRDAADKKYQNQHKLYDKQVAFKQEPDITQYKFVVLKSKIELTKYSAGELKDDIDRATAEATDAQYKEQTQQKQTEADVKQASEEETARLQEISAKTQSKQFDVNVEQFMDPNNNSIVRSFRSAGGQGIAGFIESMSFDWYSGVTWDISDSTTKAPKMCKVTLSFAPIHDIPPGLDATGDNRAPIYAVGEHKPTTKFGEPGRKGG